MNRLKGLFIFLFLMPHAYALNTVDTGFQVLPDELKTIVAHGVCKKVWNTGTSPHFVATKTSMEWTNFYVNYPADLTVRDCVASCSNLKKSGVNTSGVYSLEIPGLGARDLYCEMAADGGGWTRVFRHNISAGYFATPSAALSANPTDPTQTMYSILDQLDNFRASNRLTFRMYWSSLDKRNIWSQTSNPIYDSPLLGYRGLSLDDATKYWGGIELSNRESNGINNNDSSLLDGSVYHTNWWFAIGATGAFNGGIPGAALYDSNGVPEVELYVHDGGLYPQSCQQILDMGESKGSGIYTIYPNQKDPVDTYCEMEIDNGGWTLFYANAAAADLPVKKSMHGHITDATGISFNAAGANHPHTTGALDIDDFQATQIMTRDVANWGASDFSTVEFQNPDDLKDFVHHRQTPVTDICRNIPRAGMFVFRNSQGANYWFDTLNNYGGADAGVGWGDCHPSGTDQTDASDVESRPRHWTYQWKSATDTGRVRGVGGFNLGNASVIGRYYVRENYDQPKNCMDILLSGQSKGDGTYTIYPLGNPVSVECDMTTKGGGWTKVWHGYPSDARYNDTSQEVYSRSNSIAFNQMRMQGVNIGVDIIDTTLATAYLKKTIPEYFQQVVAGVSTNKPKVKFANFAGVENVGLAGNHFFKGYGNSWRVFYTCVNVDPTTDERLYLGGRYQPGCPVRDTFDKASISTCTGSGYDYCSNSMSSTETDATMGLTLKQYQETAVWVRSVPTMRSCREIKDRGFSYGDGVYLIDPDGAEGATEAFRTYCDMTTDGGGWTLVWSNTREGTNKPVTNLSYSNAVNTRPRCSAAQSSANDFTGECTTMIDSTNFETALERTNYFVGLEHWRNLTRNEDFQMRYRWSADYGRDVDMDAVALAKAFSPADSYRIQLSNYRNIVGSELPSLFTGSNNGNQFTTVDADNDVHSSNCASNYSGSPFWYSACWSGSFSGGGELEGNGYFNGAYWRGTAKVWADPATGTGAGNGWVFVREFKTSSRLKNSCKEILEDDPTAASGHYTISTTPGSTTDQQVVYCDMDTDGGGWTLVSYSNGTATSTLPAAFFASNVSPTSVHTHTEPDTRASINPEEFSLKAGTTDAMFISPSYNTGLPIIDNGFGPWDYNTTKCTGTLRHTSRTAGCSGQNANDNFDGADALNLAVNSGNEGIVPNYGPEKCYSGKGSCSFKFFLR